MPKAISFDSKDEIIAALKKRRWEHDLAKAQKHKHEDLGPLTAIYTSVGSNTYRSFPKYGKTSPSVVFRNWASKELFDGALAELRKIKSNVQYRGWAFHLAKRLDREWSENLRYRLNLPRALKLVNLLAKGLCLVTPLWPNHYKTIVQYLDVPLDQFSLRPLACIKSFGYLRSASMGSVKTREQYTEIQDTIRELCEKAGVPPIAYDLLMWDGAH